MAAMTILATARPAEMRMTRTMRTMPRGVVKKLFLGGVPPFSTFKGVWKEMK